MPFAAALSEHPEAPEAVGEVVGAVFERLERVPDLAVLFLGPTHVDRAEEIGAAVRSLVRPRVLLGCTASTVVGPRREVEDGPAPSLWAGSLGSVRPFRLATVRLGQGSTGIVGFPAPDSLPADARAVLVLADPFSFPVDAFLEGLAEQTGVHLPVVGGLASAARGPGGNRLLFDGEVATDGAVGAVLGGVGVRPVVSQGCRPIGTPMVVTRGADSRIEELAGRPALERVQEVLGRLDPDELAMARQGLHVGRVVDEHKDEYERGDFLVRNVVGLDRGSGALVVGDDVQVGHTVQLHVRDAGSADEDLISLLGGARADGALLFTCNGRGTALFGEEDHDATLVTEALGAPVAGMSCAGELGPVGSRSFLHGFTASVVLFSEPGTRPGTGGTVTW
jgi:small ligand-binding sensory domain FIST